MAIEVDLNVWMKTFFFATVPSAVPEPRSNPAVPVVQVTIAILNTILILDPRILNRVIGIIDLIKKDIFLLIVFRDYNCDIYRVEKS